MPQVKPTYLQHMLGVVLELQPAHKAIIGFTYDNEPHRALLWSDRLLINGLIPTVKEDICDHLSPGTKVAFKCHALDATGKDNCGWFIVAAVRQELRDRQMDSSYLFGMVNATGVLGSLGPRHGVLEVVGQDGSTERVLFRASKVYLYGKRLGSKQRCDKALEKDEEFNLDAVPVNPSGNQEHCSWLATAVWKGNRPEEARNYGIDQDAGPVDFLAEMRLLSTNPKGVFWRGFGHVCTVLNEELAVLLARFRPNQYETVVMHRSYFTLENHGVNDLPLTELLEPGDRVQIVCVPAPLRMMVQWIAAHVSPDMDASSQDNADVMD